jgi:hypothetical protein
MTLRRAGHFTILGKITCKKLGRSLVKVEVKKKEIK